MARRVVHFDRFDKGEFGLIGEWDAAPGSFTGRNVVRYADGSVGPRNGFKAFAFENVPVRHTAVAAFVGTGEMGFSVPWFVAREHTEDGITVAYRVYQARMFGAALVLLGTLTTNTGSTSSFSAARIGRVSYLVHSTGQVYKVDHVAKTLAAIAGSPAGRAIAQYGERTIVAGPSSEGTDPNPNQNRLFYSAPADPTSWPVANYIDIGDSGSPIVGVWALRGGLVIAKGLPDLSWWILTGVPGVNHAVRHLRSGSGTISNDAVGLAGDDTVGLAVIGSRTPAVFTGIETRSEKHLVATDTRRVFRLQEERDFGLFGLQPSGEMIVSRYGMWLRHSMTLDGVLGLFGLVIAADLTRSGFNDDGRVVVPKDDLSGMHVWQAYNDRPPFSADVNASILDPADVHFTLPEWWSRDGKEIRVEKVVVDLRKWNTGDADPNTITVTVTPTRLIDGRAEGEARSHTWSEATSAASTSGTDHRLVVPLDCQHAGGFRLKFSGIRGVAVQKALAVIDDRPLLGG